MDGRTGEQRGDAARFSTAKWNAAGRHTSIASPAVENTTDASTEPAGPVRATAADSSTAPASARCRRIALLVGALAFAALASACLHAPADTYARDRAQISNVVYSYAHHYDAGRIDEFLALFADDATIQFMPAPAGGKEILEGLRARRASFEARGEQRRHVMTNLVIHSQDAQVAGGEVYVILFSTRDATFAPLLTGRYVFGMRKIDGAWRIAEWRAYLDGRAHLDGRAD